MEDDVKDFIALITAGELDDELIDIEQAILHRRLELGVSIREVAAVRKGRS